LKRKQILEICLFSQLFFCAMTNPEAKFAFRGLAASGRQLNIDACRDGLRMNQSGSNYIIS
jgi:hypothetical protein